MSNDHHGVTVFPHVIEVAPEPEAPPIPGDVAAQLWSTYGDEWCIRLIDELLALMEVAKDADRRQRIWDEIETQLRVTQ